MKVSRKVFWGANGLPLSNSSSVSPAVASDEPRPTRNVVAVLDSTRFMKPSESLLEPCSTGAAGGVGAVVSIVKASGMLCGPELPAASRTIAVSDLLPSAPRSLPFKEKVTKPLAISPASSVTVLGVENAVPPRKSSTVSPARAPDPVSPTRIVVAAAASAAFSRLSERFVVPCSTGATGAAGATVSSVKARAPLGTLVPTRFLAVAVSDLAPSAPRSAAETVNVTKLLLMSLPVSTWVLAVANGDPPSSSSTVSPAIAPDVPRSTRIVVAVLTSLALSLPSASLLDPCSAGTAGGSSVSVTESENVFSNHRPPASVARTRTESRLLVSKSSGPLTSSWLPLTLKSALSVDPVPGTRLKVNVSPGVESVAVSVPTTVLIAADSSTVEADRPMSLGPLGLIASPRRRTKAMSLPVWPPIRILPSGSAATA